MTLTLPVRDELHQWAHGEGVSAESEELAEVCARNIICGTIYDGDIARNRQLASAQSLLPPPNTQAPWNAFELLVLRFVHALVESKKEAGELFWLVGRRSLDSSREAFKKSMLHTPFLSSMYIALSYSET